MPNSVIDRSVYLELKENTGPEFMIELTDTFLEDSPRQIQEMRTALISGDTDIFRRAAHSLKSNSATFGAQHLAELARELEMLAKDNKLRAAGDRLDAFDAAYHEAAIELKGLR